MDTQKKATVRGKAGESTRKMQRSRMVVALAILLLIWLAIFVYSRNVKSVMSFGLIGTLVAVGLFLFVIKLLEKKGNVTLKRAKQAERGAIAEEHVGQFLDNLPDGNFVIHDFDSERGNIDHILISPKGIFTLETKSHKGSVEFDGKNLVLNGRVFEKDFLKQAWAQCYLARKILSEWGITDPKPEPMIIFTNAYVQVRGKAKGVEVVTLGYFKNLLSREPDRLSTPEAGRIFNRLKAANKKST